MSNATYAGGVQSLSSTQVQRLIHEIPFPAARKSVIRTARQLRFPGACIRFLELFSPDVSFPASQDFEAECEELALLHAEEQASPKEFLRSP